MMNFDVGVIGGGAIGLACAWKLTERGARVALFERDTIGHEASWAAGGMLAAQCEAAHHFSAQASDDSFESSQRDAMWQFCLQSRSLYPRFAAQLLDATGIDIELLIRGHEVDDWRQPGILYIKTADDDRAYEALLNQRSAGQRVEEAPYVTDFDAAWLPDEGQVENRKLVTALHVALRRAGVPIHIGEAFIEGNSIVCNGERHSCGAILLCAGAWNGEQKWPVRIPVQPVAGQMLVVQGERLLDRVVYASDVYLIPRRDGRLLIGATTEDTGFKKRVTAGGVRRLLNAAQRLVPELETCVLIDHWAGLRPVAEDGLPLLGQTDQAGIYVAAGHGRNGILLTPATAQLLTDSILEGRAVPESFDCRRLSRI